MASCWSVHNIQVAFARAHASTKLMNEKQIDKDGVTPASMEFAQLDEAEIELDQQQHT